jgi:hypothetical protein
MGLSADPEKRARQEAALRKGNPKAFTRKPGEPGSSQAEPGKKPAIRARRSQAPPAAPARPRPPRAPQTRQAERKKGFWDGLFS